MTSTDTGRHRIPARSANPYGPQSREIPVTVATVLLLLLALVATALLSGSP